MKSRHLYITLFSLFFQLYIQAQTGGDLYLHNYIPQISNIDNHNIDAVQGKNEVMYFANTKGILTYDGITWDIIKTEGTPYSLAEGNSENEILYIGCAENFGYLTQKENGEYKYHIISKANRDFGEIKKILITTRYVFFYSDQVLFRVNKDNHKVEEVWIAQKYLPYAGIFKISNRIFLNIRGKGLHEVSGRERTLFVGKKDFSRTYLNTSLDWNQEKVLIGTDENELFWFDGSKFEKFEIEANEYLKENEVIASIKLSNQEIVLATLLGGCLVINEKGKTIQTINYQTGLADDEVLAICKDAHDGIWICNEYGIARADIHLPLEIFSDFPGLEGQIISLIKQDTTLYVATSEGLFYLEKVKNFAQLTTLVKQEEIKLQKVETNSYTTIRVKEDINERGKVGRLWHSVFGKKTKEEKLKQKEARRKRREERRKRRKKGKNQETVIEEEVNQENPDNIVSITSSIEEIESEPETIIKNIAESITSSLPKTYALQSIPFIYKKIKTVSGKCTQMLNYDNKILVAGNKGLYEVKGSSSKWIIKNTIINFIYQSKENPDRFYLGTEQGLISAYYNSTGTWTILNDFQGLKSSIYSITEKDNILWLGGESVVYKVQLDKKGNPVRSRLYNLPNVYREQIIVRKIMGELTVFSSDGVFRYNAKDDKLIFVENLQKLFNPRSKILFHQAKHTWTKLRQGWTDIQYYNKKDKKLKTSYLKLFQEIEDIYIDQEENIWVVSNNILYKIDPKAELDFEKKFRVFIKEITDKQGNKLSLKKLKLNYKNNGLRFELSAPFFIDEKSTEFQYKIEGIDEEWQTWTRDADINIPFLPSGSYKLKVRAKNVFGELSEEAEYEFEITPPFWQTWWFYTLLILVILALFYLFFKLRTRALKNANEKLERKVEQKTSEIREQKNKLEVAYHEIEKKNKDITGSINYAQRIQNALLPHQTEIKQSLQDTFILYKPRDVVSGDFYWFTQKDFLMIYAVADCTGHGVPGAFMSMIGHSLLNQIINEKKVYEPAEILNQLDKGIKQALHQGKNQLRDGMDISVCVINQKNNQIIFAGANNPLYACRHGKLETIKADRMGIGGSIAKSRAFTNHFINIKQDTYFYMFSDGYADQFGKQTNRKFMKKRFRNLLADIHHKTGEEQEIILNKTIEDWKGNVKQIDDILVVGFRLGKTK